jgi:DNA polymerase-3 subunit chi
VTRVDFYLLRQAMPNGRLLLACRLAEKAYAQGRRVYAHTDTAASAARLDEVLWTFRQGSFVPHELHPPRTPDCPVVIGHGVEPPEPNDVLLNLADDLPMFFSRFERVAEIVDADPTARERARERYRYYRERGYALGHHEIEL